MCCSAPRPSTLERHARSAGNSRVMHWPAMRPSAALYARSGPANLVALEPLLLLVAPVFCAVSTGYALSRSVGGPLGHAFNTPTLAVIYGWATAAFFAAGAMKAGFALAVFARRVPLVSAFSLRTRVILVSPAAFKFVRIVARNGDLQSISLSNHISNYGGLRAHHSLVELQLRGSTWRVPTRSVIDARELSGFEATVFQLAARFLSVDLPSRTARGRLTRASVDAPALLGIAADRSARRSCASRVARGLSERAPSGHVDMKSCETPIAGYHLPAPQGFLENSRGLQRRGCYSRIMA